MRTNWILVADAGRARIFSRVELGKVFGLVLDLENPAGRARDQDIMSDEPGRFHKGGSGHGREVMSALDPRTDPHEYRAKEFAIQLAERLNQAGERDEYDNLILFAPAHFLGYLRAELNPVAQKRLVRSEAKDLSNLTVHEMEKRLPELLALK